MNDIRSLDKGEIGRTFSYLEIFAGLDKHPENPIKGTAIETDTETVESDTGPKCQNGVMAY